MSVIVVFESMWGNTRTVGEAIAEGLRITGPVIVGTVDQIAVDLAATAELLVAGGPTHSYGIARATARRKLASSKLAGKYGPVLPGRTSLREWLERLPPGRGSAAAFDTRYDRPRWLTGSASRPIARLLAGKGYAVVGTGSFLVSATGGPLRDGELDRAVAWGRDLAAVVREVGEARAPWQDPAA